MNITERYELIDDNHGEGGFGKIEKRRDKQLDRFVAVKQLRLFNDEEARERFKREAKILAKLSHPNIPAIYDVEFYDDNMLIMFEYVEGNNLRHIINQPTVSSIDQAKSWFTSVAAAIDHAHKNGVIHRDIKPENIIISSDFSAAFLVDFGIALSRSDIQKLTDQGYVIGTPAYMSPEQRQGMALDNRTDIYSLGLTLYETLSGQLPNPGQYKKLSDLNESIPPAVDDLILKCLNEDRQLRLATGKDFIKELRNSFRTDIPLSRLLTDARLHEIIAALNQLSPDEFHSKPIGQRLLIINRLKDLLRTGKVELNLATARFISLLMLLCIYESEENYRSIVQAGLEWGFDKEYSENWQGDQEVRDTVIDAAKVASKNSYPVIASEFVKFLSGKSLEDKKGWYIHDLRKIVIALLAHTECGNEKTAQSLAELYDKINLISH